MVAHLGAADDLPGLVEHADGDAGAVDVEPDVEHGCLQKSGYARRTPPLVPRYRTDRGLLHSFTTDAFSNSARRVRVSCLECALPDPKDAGNSWRSTRPDYPARHAPSTWHRGTPTRPGNASSSPDVVVRRRSLERAAWSSMNPGIPTRCRPCSAPDTAPARPAGPLARSAPPAATRARSRTTAPGDGRPGLRVGKDAPGGADDVSTAAGGEPDGIRIPRDGGIFWPECRARWGGIRPCGRGLDGEGTRV